MSVTRLDRRVLALRDRYRSPAVLLDRPYPPHSASVGRSFFGGLPNLPDSCTWPRTPSGKPLHFLCQVDCGQIRWNTALPSHGFLFFFGRDDEEQSWGSETPQDDCRVIYIPDASIGDRATQPPTDLPPIGREAFSARPLPGEQPRRVHVKWPIRPLPMDSFPDTSGLPPLISHHDRSNRRLFEDLIRDQRPLSDLRYFDPVNGMPKSPKQPIWNRYDELLPTFRAREIENSTGPIKDRYSLEAQNIATQRMFEEDEFPSHWVFIYFFSRAALQRYRGKRLHGHPAPTAEESTLRANREEQIDREARVWFERSRAVPLDTQVREDDRREFRTWVANVGRGPKTPPGIYPIDWLRSAATEAVRAWAGDPILAAKLSTATYECVGDLFQICNVQRYEEGDHYNFYFSQMLGHVPCAQDAQAADDPDICLLNIASDFGLGWMFGDMGACSFWITPAELSARDFSRVRGTIDGH